MTTSSPGRNIQPRLDGSKAIIINKQKHNKSAICQWSCVEHFSCFSVFRTILEKMGMQGRVETHQARKKWDNLKKKYKVGAGLNDDVETNVMCFTHAS